MVALLTRLYLEQSEQSSRTKKLLSVLLLLLLNDAQEEKLAQVLIDVESWEVTTTGVHAVLLQDCVFHYFCFLLQNEYRTFLRANAVPFAGCLASSEFAAIFTVLSSYIEHGYSISNNIILQYALFFMSPEVGIC